MIKTSTAASGDANNNNLNTFGSAYDATTGEKATAAEVYATELPYRTRGKVVSLPGKPIRDIVYKYLHADMNGGSSSGAGAKPSSSSSLSGAKRPRPDGESGGAGSAVVQRIQGTPIIILQSSPSTLFSLRNIAQFLERGEYINPSDAPQLSVTYGSNSHKVTITRNNPGVGMPNKFHIVDDISLLRNRDDWIKVVGVIVAGPDWHFTDWRWGRKESEPALSVVEILSRCRGFHFHYDNDVPHENAAKWNVKLLPISRVQKHQHSSVYREFWSELERFIFINKRGMLKQ